MTMTRKDFEAIAKALHDAHLTTLAGIGGDIAAGPERQAARTAHADTVSAVADALGGTNPRFDRYRFTLVACGQY